MSSIDWSSILNLPSRNGGDRRQATTSQAESSSQGTSSGDEYNLPPDWLTQPSPAEDTSAPHSLEELEQNLSEQKSIIGSAIRVGILRQTNDWDEAINDGWDVSFTGQSNMRQSLAPIKLGTDSPQEEAEDLPHAGFNHHNGLPGMERSVVVGQKRKRSDKDDGLVQFKQKIPRFFEGEGSFSQSRELFTRLAAIPTASQSWAADKDMSTEPSEQDVNETDQNTTTSETSPQENVIPECAAPTMEASSATLESRPMVPDALKEQRGSKSATRSFSPPIAERKRSRSVEEAEESPRSSKRIRIGYEDELEASHVASIPRPVLDDEEHHAISDILRQKDQEIEALREELAEARSEIRQLQNQNTYLRRAKGTLARKVYLEQCVETGRMFSATDSQPTAAVAGPRQGEFVDLPEGITPGEVFGLPPAIVRSDILEIDGLVIRCKDALGGGANGRVVSGKVLRGEECEEVAIKVLWKSHGIGELEREVRTMKKLADMGVAPKFVAAVETPDRFLVIMERCAMSLSDLRQKMKRLQKSSEARDGSKLGVIAWEIINLVKKMHDSGYVHRDIKPDNILINKSGHLVLTDFGSSGPISTPIDGPCGTLAFAAPEWWAKGKKDAKASDIVVRRRDTDLGAEWQEQARPVAKEVKDFVKEMFPLDVWKDELDFFSKCLMFTPSKRMTAEEAIKHPCFADMPENPSENGQWLDIVRSVETSGASAKGTTDPYHLNLGIGKSRELVFD